MFPKGYLTLDVLWKFQNETIVSGPKRPIYITAIETSLEADESSGVIPVERPTVADALTISNKISIKPSVGSKMQSKNVETAITEAPIKTITDAFL